jgi:hypothetical protein
MSLCLIISKKMKLEKIATGQFFAFLFLLHKYFTFNFLSNLIYFGLKKD